MYRGHDDIVREAALLAERLPPGLMPLARLAYNMRWAWTPSVRALFEDIDADLWHRSGNSPVEFLQEVSSHMLDGADGLGARAQVALTELERDLARPMRSPVAQGPTAERPIAFLCAEFGLHASLPTYAGGLGVMAGDVLKEASDSALPLVGVGLFYRNGYFHQRLDRSGWQHEYWTAAAPYRMAMTCVRNDDGTPLQVTAPFRGEQVHLLVWRVNVGRVPLYLLDSDLPINPPAHRWITARLYEVNTGIRLAQYSVLGIGGMRALQAMGIEPSRVHLNEGHGAFAAMEMLAREMQSEPDFGKAQERVRRLFVFTTHAPIASRNEAYSPGDVHWALEGMPERLGLDAHSFLGLGRMVPDDPEEKTGLTPLAIRMSARTNAVSERHGETARASWKPLFPDAEEADVPIAHVTNGVHVPTWLGLPMRRLLDLHLGDGWITRTAEPATWERVAAIPDEELWETRNTARRQLMDFVRAQSVADRLRRGEDLEYVEAAAKYLDADVLTVGFARRLAQYKRLHLLTANPNRALALLGGLTPIQLLFAGKAHPADDGAKGLVKGLFSLKSGRNVAERVAFLENYDMRIGRAMVSGCDVWINLPRPPFEASGTSGMKSALNGGLHLSVLDGWWSEAYDGSNGWAIESPSGDLGAQDLHDANAFYDLMENEVVPLFNQRDEQGIPRGWCALIKRSLMSIGPRFSATRMMNDYWQRIYQ